MDNSLYTKTVSDIIEDDYKEWDICRPERWRLGDLIFIFAGTGSGKTTFALKKLSMHYLRNDKKVLYLVPRVILENEIDERMRAIIDKDSYNAPKYHQNFEILTYQALQNELINHNNTYEEYDLIICDECHYFITDSLFNDTTQVSYKFIFDKFLNRENKTIIVLLTATPKNLVSYVQKNILEKSVADDKEKLEDMEYASNEEWKRFHAKEESVRNMIIEPTTSEDTKLKFDVGLKSIYIYKLPKTHDNINVKYIINDDEIIEIIRNTDKKSIVFVSSKTKGKQLKANLNNKYKIESDFITAENKNNESENVVDELVKVHKFSKKVLIATSVLDVGVNIIDTEVENVIIAHTEETEFLQMLGRIRTTSDDNSNQEITLYIYQRNTRYFQILLDKNIVKKIKCCECLESYSNLNDLLKEDLKNKLPENYKEFLYVKNNEIIMNKLSPYYLRRLHDSYEDIKDGLKKDKNYFIKIQLKWLGKDENDFCEENFYYLELKNIYIKMLQESIEKAYVKIKNGTTKNECSEMLNNFKPYIRKIDNKFIRSNENLSVKKFNEFCKLNNIPYHIDKKPVNRKTMYYMVNYHRP